MNEEWQESTVWFSHGKPREAQARLDMGSKIYELCRVGRGETATYKVDNVSWTYLTKSYYSWPR